MQNLPPASFRRKTALIPQATGVGLFMKGVLNMAQITINLPDSNTPEGVTLETIEAHVKLMGNRSIEEYVNLLLADALGFRPLAPGAEKNFPQLVKLAREFDAET